MSRHGPSKPCDTATSPEQDWAGATGTVIDEGAEDAAYLIIKSTVREEHKAKPIVWARAIDGQSLRRSAVLARSRALSHGQGAKRCSKATAA